ncbi:MAG: HAD-IA family hydrolase [Alphaproteobacteria bacterium]|nr:HAD-IA family hydrolase [Alphaproteobacteria bacterium]
MTVTSHAILFDLDGTLVDSEPGIRASYRAVMRELGHDPDRLDLTGLIGPPLEDGMAKVLAREGDTRVAEGVRLYREHYGREGLFETRLYPGIVDMLDRLAKDHARLFVATSKQTAFARRILEHLGLAPHFVAIQGAEPGGVERKADVIGALLAAHDLPEPLTLMVGDRHHDVDGARAHGLATIGVLWGYGAREELAGAQWLVDRPAELSVLVTRILAGGVDPVRGA